MVQQIRGSRWRHAVVLGPVLLIELALAVLVFSGNFLPLSLPLFASGALCSTGAYVLLLRRWPLTPGPWARFALSLGCAFAAFQVSLLLFGLIAGFIAVGGISGNAIGAVIVVFVGGNAIFFPVWLLLGSLTFVLVRLTNPAPPRPRAPSAR